MRERESPERAAYWERIERIATALLLLRLLREGGGCHDGRSA